MQNNNVKVQETVCINPHLITKPLGGERLSEKLKKHFARFRKHLTEFYLKVMKKVFPSKHLCKPSLPYAIRRATIDFPSIGTPDGKKDHFNGDKDYFRFTLHDLLPSEDFEELLKFFKSHRWSVMIELVTITKQLFFTKSIDTEEITFAELPASLQKNQYIVLVLDKKTD